MKKMSILLGAVFFLCGCSSFTASSSMPVSSSTEASSSAQASSSTAVSSSATVSSSVPESTSAPSSSSAVASSSIEPDLRDKIELSLANPVSFSSGNGHLVSGKMDFSVTKCAAGSSASDWFILNQGGYLTNTTPYGLSFSSITVDYLRQSDFGYLTARASSFAISSPQNGAYELTGSTTFTFPGNAVNTYFSLHAPIGSFLLKSITLTGVALDKSADTAISSLDFYTINDTHGAAQNINDSAARTYQSGITRLSTFALDTERNAPESSVFLSSGDMWQGSADSNLTRGELMVNWMNVAGFESMAIGNHEFDWRAETIAKNSEKANFPFLSINLIDGAGVRPSWAQASKIVRRGGYKIGVIGAIGKLESSIAVSSLSGYSFKSDYDSLVSAEADRLRKEEGCALVVLSIHNGSFDTTYCHNIDAVFEGHTHLSYEEKDTYGIPHVQTYANGSDIQHVRFTLQEGKFVFDSYDDVRFATLSALDEEPMTLGVFGYYNGKNAPIINEVIGHSESALSKDSIGLYAVQCMYEFYTASAWDSSIAMAIINQGGVRQNIPAGDITYGQVYASLPFDNDNVICSCDGATYKNYVTKTGCYRYPTNVDTSKIVDTQIYHLVLISYVSEKDSSLTEITRDADNRLRDILAADFRRNYNA